MNISAIRQLSIALFKIYFEFYIHIYFEYILNFKTIDILVKSKGIVQETANEIEIFLQYIYLYIYI